MKIARFNIFQYRLPLYHPIMIHGKTLKIREGLIIKLTNEQGIFAYGEITPLPVLCQESLDSVRNQAIELSRVLRGQSIPKGVEKLEGKFESWLGAYHLWPSLRFGLEMAVLNLLGQTKKLPFGQLVRGECPNEVYVNGLLGDGDISYEAKQMMGQGFRSIKLKVGRGSLSVDIAKVQRLRKIIRGHAKLRLDANQGWDLTSAVIFGKEIGREAIDYIEEPLRDKSRIPDFFCQTHLPVALDESLVSLDLKEGKPAQGLKALILKPTLLGGFEKTMQIIHRAKKLKIQTVISSSFETGVGLIALANFSACVGIGRTPAGLDTIKWFKRDLLKERLNPHTSVFDIEKLFRKQNNIEEHLLERLSDG